MEVSALSARRARWLCLAALAFAAGCNTYDEAIGDPRADGHAPSTSDTTTGIVGQDGAHGGGGGSGVDDAAGGGGGSTGSDAPPVEPDSPSEPDGAGSGGSGGTTSPDAGKDGRAPIADAGVDTGTVVDVRSEPPPVVRDAGLDVPTGGESMIDDMEDPDDAILTVEGRRGAWFVLNDGTDGGVQSPAQGAPFLMTAIPGGRGASMYAAHTSGHGFTTWSPLVGFWVNKAPSAFKQLYDASRYNAITFWAKASPSDAAAFSMSVRVQFPDRDTDPDGQICTADGSMGCSDHFGKTILLTTDWVKYTLRFNSLQQAGFGMAAPSFDAAHMYGIEFQFSLGSTFDCWIDDIAFASL